MPRFLILVIFLATCCCAFMSGSLYAGVAHGSAQKFKSPQEGLAKLLKNTHKKSSTDAKLSGVKKSSKLKSAYHKTKSSKKFAQGKKTHKNAAYARNHHKKAKSSFGKTKHYKKAYKHKTTTAHRSL